jgi:hypothetical protein
MVVVGEASAAGKEAIASAVGAALFGMHGGKPAPARADPAGDGRRPAPDSPAARARNQTLLDHVDQPRGAHRVRSVGWRGARSR